MVKKRHRFHYFNIFSRAKIYLVLLKAGLLFSVLINGLGKRRGRSVLRRGADGNGSTSGSFSVGKVIFYNNSRR